MFTKSQKINKRSPLLFNILIVLAEAKVDFLPCDVFVNTITFLNDKTVTIKTFKDKEH